jgi:hypothetical protein
VSNICDLCKNNKLYFTEIKCATCKMILPIDNFYPSQGNVIKRLTHCIPCHGARLKLTKNLNAANLAKNSREVIITYRNQTPISYAKGQRIMYRGIDT